MAYLSQEQLLAMNFKQLGTNVKISDKASIYNPEFITIGNNSRIDDFCVISGKITVGNYVHIAAFCLIAGGTEGIIIEDFAGISYGSQIFSQSDDYSGQFMVSPLVPAEYKNELKALVTIGRHVIIGASSVVFPGVHVAEGCSVGAMTLVTKSTTPWGIYTGIPAKRVKEKSKAIELLEKKFLTEEGSH
ncbi:acyltransferase [Legionella oakridgensis]|uniref:Chloramphenicol acetyltransferase n=2 Tax=Legionella oakridgensis TaxID=29423 RepID=W0BAP9_9GAMM|nr:O-acetyltransferase [Legionella oakridgensis]AHE67623.1 acetyltransferase [Legionella oakridgensis ATCC 33761 = DSM 21215]ETO92860.1 acetyltransferase (isoleucine patch superfamily) [Legionella oakridgensis RV-2-2007]KTD37033.1 chloramphenicol acetyltransferase [Legionella oakridgensis]STY20658.1 putative lipopolysaccharide biosynthesis O-acetyl transferase WbbJ [Legionella longbeachae]